MYILNIWLRQRWEPNECRRIMLLIFSFIFIRNITTWKYNTLAQCILKLQCTHTHTQRTCVKWKISLSILRDVHNNYSHFNRSKSNVCVSCAQIVFNYCRLLWILLCAKCWLAKAIWHWMALDVCVCFKTTTKRLE